MWVSTAKHRSLPGPVIVGGVTYYGTGGTRSWVFNENNQLNRVGISIPGSHSDISVGCYYTTGTTVQWKYWDTISIAADGYGTWGTMQTKGRENDPTLIGLGLESCGPLPHNATNQVGDVVITVGKTYWVSLKFAGSVGYVYGAVFDPDNGFAQVGTTYQAVTVQGAVVSTTNTVMFGRDDGHGNYSDVASQGYFDQILDRLYQRRVPSDSFRRRQPAAQRTGQRPRWNRL